jgi:putative membrane protein
MNLLIKWLVSALALLIVSSILPGIVVSSLYTALIVALFLGLLNALVRPVLFVLTLPINIVTLGLFTFVLNGLIFWFVASFIQGFAVDGFLSAILGALLVSIISWAGNEIFVGKRHKRPFSGPRSNHESKKDFYHVDKIEKPEKD